MKPLDWKYLIVRKQDVVSVCSIDPITDHKTFLGPSDPERARTFFDMGHLGAQCQRLAFAILYDFTGLDVMAYRLENAFEFDFVQRWVGASVEIDGATIAGWIDANQSIIGKAVIRQEPERVAPGNAASDSHHGEPL
jgi:hypothetical protein